MVGKEGILLTAYTPLQEAAIPQGWLAAAMQEYEPTVPSLLILLREAGIQIFQCNTLNFRCWPVFNSN